MTRALVVLALPWLLLACTPSIPDGVFECQRDEDCPPGLTCDVAIERCYGPDGG
ncbi:MAG: hypothetical protein R3B82_16780 [Sandaracinaceae bacterium]